ncbi:MAG: nucleoside deaminase [Tardiphaga sp.]|nr:nucleoside deaminase [Tardiphaga sp.]
MVPDDGILDERDTRFVRQAIALAERAKAAGRHPFGALVVAADGTVLAEAGNNAMPPEGDPTQHAERLAVAAAAQRHSPQTLAKATLYTSAEPCAMCAGAIYWCHVGRVVYALSEQHLLKLTGNHPENPTLSLPCRTVFASGQRPVEVIGPIAALAEEAAQAHVGFWTS